MSRKEYMTTQKGNLKKFKEYIKALQELGEEKIKNL